MSDATASLYKTRGQNIMRASLLLASGLAAAVLSTVGLAAQAADYPVRPVTIVVPAPPGGLTDTTARLFADKLREKFGQPFIIENKPGASLMIGTNAVAKAAPDGYTILLTISTHVQNPHLQKSIPYDSVKDFAPLALINLTPVLFTVNSKLGVNSVAQFATAAKTGNFSYGSFGVGTTPHILGRLLAKNLGIEMLHVPFKGEAPVMNEILAGQITTSFLSPMVAMPHIRAGTLTPLAVTSPNRMAELPDVPTFKELGYPSMDITSWTGFLAPAGTPQDVVAKLSDALVQATKDPAMEKRLRDSGLVPHPLGYQEFGSFMTEQYKRWGEAIRESGVTLDGA